MNIKMIAGCIAAAFLLSGVTAQAKPIQPGVSASLDISAKRHKKAKRVRLARSTSLSGIVSPELISKTREIVSACGSVVVSARAGRGYRSNHPIGRAVDLSGNPSCIYAHLHGWPGGYSTDYHSAPGGRHVHISYNPGGQEWGVRFVHNHGRHRHPRSYAKANPSIDRFGAY